MSLLINERPLIVQPSLVKLLGSIERAVVLQQIHWLLQQPKTGEIDEDGNKWVWGTLQDWCDDYFQMWKPPALKKHLRWLRENDYLIVDQRSEDRWKKTNYYRLNYEKITHHEGNDDYPSKGNDRYLSKGTDDYPSKGNDRYPSYKEQRLQQRLQQIDIGHCDQNDADDDKLGFEEFWLGWPKKVARVPAEKAWSRLSAKNRALAMKDIKTRYTNTEKRFIPNPATYLNQRRWEDEPISESSRTGKDRELYQSPTDQFWERTKRRIRETAAT